jgi:hypothetical protein
MRRGRDAEQRVWLGPGRYRGCCRNAAADSASESYANAWWDSMRAGDANANADCYSDHHTYGDGNCHGHAECNSVTDTYGNGYSYNYSISDTYCSAKSNTEASADSASSAVSP